jgi:hypothetical protein
MSKLVLGPTKPPVQMSTVILSLGKSGGCSSGETTNERARCKNCMMGQRHATFI